MQIKSFKKEKSNRGQNLNIERQMIERAMRETMSNKAAAKFLGVKYGILANSGSSAGLLVLSALELPRGSEVIIPATTFPTIFNIILQCGLIPVVVDCNPKTNNIDIEKLEALS